MAKFCTTCGTRNDDSAAFCEECGKPLRLALTAPNSAPRASEHTAVSASPSALGRWLVPAAVGAVALIGVIGLLAWWMSPPAPNASAFAAALNGESGVGAAPSAELLCLGNLPYNNPQIAVAQYDSNTRQWMDALAAAGLYTSGQPVQGLFQQVIQYTPTAELAKWRQGARLCLGKSWSVREIRGERFTPEKRGQHTIYRATVVWKADATAPWVAQASAVVRQLPGVRLDRGALTAETSQFFEVRGRRWVVLTAADQAQIQRETLQAGLRGTRSDTTRKNEGGGMLSAVRSLFSGIGAAHPLVGEWAVDERIPLGLMGAALPVKNGRLSFGRDYMESGGERVKVRFEVVGDIVNVLPEGETEPIPFRMNGRDKMTMSFAFGEIPFIRVR